MVSILCILRILAHPVLRLWSVLNERYPSAFLRRRSSTLRIFTLLSLLAVIYVLIEIRQTHARNLRYLSSYQRTGDEPCIQPIIDPFDESIVRYVKYFPPYTCPYNLIHDLVFVDSNGFVQFNKTVLLSLSHAKSQVSQHGDMIYKDVSNTPTCVYRVVERNGDHHVRYTPPVELNIPIIIPTEFFKVECRLKNVLIFSKILYSIYIPHQLTPTASDKNISQTVHEQSPDKTNQQTNEEMNKQSNAQMNKQPNEQMNKQPNEQTDKQPNKQTNKQTNEQTNKQPNEQTNKQPNKQPNEQTNKQTNQQSDKHPNQQTPNIMIVAIDSLSQLNGLRKLTKTNKFLAEKLDTVIIRGYHAVGHHTYANMIPMMMGISDHYIHGQIYEQDDHNMIWKQLHTMGYVSAYAEDRPTHISTFSMNGPGFKDVPFTHYMRPYWLAVEKEHPDLQQLSPIVLAFESAFKQSGYSLCYKNSAYYDMIMDYTSRFYAAYSNTPKFSIALFNGPTHDHMNMVEILDDSLYRWFKSLYTNRHLDNTIVMLLGDHGNWIDLIRLTVIGRMELRYPFLSVSIPRDISSLPVPHSIALQNLISNQDQLITSYDIYETMREISVNPTLKQIPVIKDKNYYKPVRNVHPNARKAESLFRKIPDNRTCTDVHIAEELCACFYIRPVDRDDPLLPTITEYLMQQINLVFHLDYTVRLKSVVKSEIIKPGLMLLDVDRTVTWFKHSPVKGVFVYYKVKVLTEPKLIVYEGTVMYRMDSGHMSVYRDITQM